MAKTEFEAAAQRAAKVIAAVTSARAQAGYDQKDGWIVKAEDPQGNESVTVTVGDYDYDVNVSQMNF